MKPVATRREVLQGAISGAGVALAGGFALTALVRGAKAKGFAPLPPGTAARFTDLCTKCGICVRDCPFDALRLAGVGDEAPLGTPWFSPRNNPCRMCTDIPCVRNCPSGALDRDFEDIKKARMGIAVVDPASCLSWQGLRCEVCWRVCPVKNEAITLVPHPREISKHAVFVPTITPDKCTGCGMCTHSCPTDVPAINVLDRARFLGRIGEHYRLGWKSDQPHHPGVVEPKLPSAKPEEAGGLDYLNNGPEVF